MWGSNTSSTIRRILKSCGTIEHLMMAWLIMLRLFTLLGFCGSTRCTQESFPALFFGSQRPCMFYGNEFLPCFNWLMKEEKEKKRKGEEMKCNWHWCLGCAGDEAQQFNPPTSSTLHHPLPFLLWYESILGAIYHLHLLTVHFLSIWHSRGLYYNSKAMGTDCEANCFSCKSCNIFRLLRLNLMNTVHVIVSSIASSRCI